MRPDRSPLLGLLGASVLLALPLRGEAQTTDPPALACTASAPLGIGALAPEAVTLRHVGTDVALDLGACSAVAFDAQTERATSVAALSGRMAPGTDLAVPLALPDGPGAVVLTSNAVAVGDGVEAVLGALIAALVFDGDGGVRGCGNGPEVRPCDNGVLTSAGGGPEADAPVALWPNPTADRAEIRYALDAPSEVVVAVYDPLGRLVASQTDGARGAGVQATAVDVSALPPGPYVVRIEAGPTVRTARLTVVR